MTPRATLGLSLGDYAAATGVRTVTKHLKVKGVVDTEFLKLVAAMHC